MKQARVYICSCCDQLWYRHSVIIADKLRQCNPDIVKYVCNKISVDNKKWICNTCYNHLIKNKVPPCAVANSMIFSEKTDFFDLNKLECRLLAPRIAFQKLMQAPRGRQLRTLYIPKFTVFNLSIEKIMPWDPCSYLVHYINWLRFKRGLPL